MFDSIAAWLGIKWRLIKPQTEIDRAYAAVFMTPEGQLVLQDLLDGIYCQVSYTSDPIALATDNGKRQIVHHILERIDQATNPGKYHEYERIQQLALTHQNGDN